MEKNNKPERTKLSATSSEQFKVEPLHALPQEEPRRGRPPIQRLEPLELDFNDFELGRYFYFIAAANKLLGKNKDMFDDMFIEMAAAEYIKYLRILQYEAKNHTSITMARQHPGVQMRALIDLLSISRKARQTSKQEKDPEKEEALKILKGLAAG